MTTITLKGIVHLSAHSINGEPNFVLFGVDMSGYGHAPIGPVEIQYELPEGFSSNGARISILEKERERINAEFAKRVKTINQQIAQLQAIEFEEA